MSLLAMQHRLDTVASDRKESIGVKSTSCVFMRQIMRQFL